MPYPTTEKLLKNLRGITLLLDAVVANADPGSFGLSEVGLPSPILESPKRASRHRARPLRTAVSGRRSRAAETIPSLR